MSDFEYTLPQGTGIKKKKGKEKFTKLQYEIYQKIYDPVNGPLEFAKHCCYVKKNGLTQYSPFDYQREMLFNMHNYQNIISLWSRQNGKTTTSAVYLLWYAMMYPYKDILITSFTETSANEILAMVRNLYENCPDFIKCSITDMNVSTMKFTNKSRIFSRPTTIKAPRGLSPAIIYCDEFAFVGSGEAAKKTLQKQEEFFSAISPALSTSHGKLAITSTPISESDLFYRLWAGAIKKTNDEGIEFPKQYILKINDELYNDFHLFNTKEEAESYVKSLNTEDKIEIVEKQPCGDNGFQSHLVTWDKSPLKDKKWEQSERKRVGDEFFEREYNCISGDSVVEVMNENGLIIPMSIKDLYSLHMV